MRVNLSTFSGLNTPIYVLEEERLRSNLSLIKSVADRADVEIILAFKAYALWKTFPIFREYIQSTTASSLSEAKLAFDKFGSPAHTFSPAYTDYEIDEIARCSSHLSFNSLSQYERYHERARLANPAIKYGLRVNPEYSEVETLLYNPCAPGTRFGVSADKLPETLPSDIEGFHCHCHCESGADVFERTLAHIEEKFAKWFPQLKWINFGGGHLMTRKDYDVLHLINILKGFHARYPHLKVIMEPGSAFGWQTGPLVTQVVDVVDIEIIVCYLLTDVCNLVGCQDGAAHIDRLAEHHATSPHVAGVGAESIYHALSDGIALLLDNASFLVEQSSDFLCLFRGEHSLAYQIGHHVVGIAGDSTYDVGT